MSWTTTLSVEELATHLDACILVDCRHRLDDPQAGAARGKKPTSPRRTSCPSTMTSPAATILAGPPPDARPRATARETAALGLSDDTQLVLYDDQGGAMAGRLWMLARWLGHEKVALLDGGFDAWKRAGYPLTAEPTAPRKAGQLSERPSLVQLLNTAQLQAACRTATARWSTPAGRPLPGRERNHRPGGRPHPRRSQPALHAELRPDGRFNPPRCCATSGKGCWPAAARRTSSTSAARA